MNYNKAYTQETANLLADREKKSIFGYFCDDRQKYQDNIYEIKTSSVKPRMKIRKKLYI